MTIRHIINLVLNLKHLIYHLKMCTLIIKGANRLTKNAHGSFFSTTILQRGHIMYYLMKKRNVLTQTSNDIIMFPFQQKYINLVI